MLYCVTNVALRFLLDVYRYPFVFVLETKEKIIHSLILNNELEMMLRQSMHD